MIGIRPVALPGTSATGWSRLAREPVLLAVLATAAGALLWILLLPRIGSDLSAQLAWADFARHYPGAAYLFNWYGGIYPAGYSLAAPYVFAALGTRPVTAVAAVAAAGLLAILLARHRVPRPRAAALWAAVALWTGLIAGRATFTLGLAAGLGAILLLDIERPARPLRLAGAAVLALATSLVSPIAGLFLGIAAVALLLAHRRTDALVLGVPAGAPFIPMLVLFAGHGVEPISVFNGVPALLAAALTVALLPRRWRLIRYGALVYAIAVLVAWLVPSPIGSNIDRLGLMLTGPLLVGLADRRRLTRVALVLAGFWLFAHSEQDFVHGSAPPTNAPATTALIHELRALHADTARVEAVPEYGHWESLELATAVPLARGWERQIDAARNPIFYRCSFTDCRLTPRAYHAWLRRNAVHYVAISTARPDYAASHEAALVRAGQPWLQPIWRNATWRLYRVIGTLPLAGPPATVVRSTPAAITLRMNRPGSGIVRVHYSPLLQATGHATLAPAGAWTRVSARRPGTYTLTASY